MPCIVFPNVEVAHNNIQSLMFKWLKIKFSLFPPDFDSSVFYFEMVLSVPNVVSIELFDV